MKKVYLLILLCCLGFTTFATTWYSTPTPGADPSVLTSWWDSPTGTGANPTSFTNPTDLFIVQSNMLMTAATWTVMAPVTMNSGYIWNNRPGGGGGGTITMNFYGTLTMNNNTSISSNTGTDNVNLYGDFFMTGTSFFNNPQDYTYVTFSNTTSSFASPQHTSATGSSQSTSEWTIFEVAPNVFVQLVDNFNAAPSIIDPYYGLSFYPFTVAGTIDCQTFSFTGTGAVDIGVATGGGGGGGGGTTTYDGGSIYTANALGVNGSILCTATGGANEFSTDGNYFFNGTVPQVTGTYLPNTFTTVTTGGGFGGGTTYAGTLTINNPAGVSLSQTTTFTDAGFGFPTPASPSITLTSGALALGGSNLLMGDLCTINGFFSSTAMIVTNGAGQLEKEFVAPGGTYTYPVGDAASNYTPITLNFTGGTFGTGGFGGFGGTPGYAGVTVVNAKDPHNANVSNYLNRYWKIAMNGITGPVYTISPAQYVPGDVVGTEANISAGNYPGALPWIKYGATNTALHQLSAATSITNSSIDFSGITTAGPVFTVTPNSNVCTGTPTVLSVLTSTADAPAYTWSPASGLSASTGSTVNAAPATNTTYTVTLTDGNGFKATNTVALAVHPGAGPILGGGAGILCVGQTIALSDAVTGGTWSTSDPSASVDASGNVTGSAAGSPFVIYTVPGGCNATLPLSVVTSAPPIVGNTTACTGVATPLTDVGPGTWSSSSTANATVNAATGVLTGVSPGNTVITYTLAPGCTATSSVTVDLNPPAITGNANACIGVTTNLTELATGGTWTSTNTAAAVVSSTGGVTGVATGATTIVYTLSSGCNATYPMGVVAVPPTITGTSHVCAGFSTSLHDSLAGGTWSSGNTALAVVNPTTGVATGLFPGMPTIFYTLLPGCFTAIPLDVISSGTPVIDIAATPGATVCPGQTIYLSTTYTAYPGLAPTYQWIKDGLVVGTGATYHYVPAAGDVVYNVMHSTFSCLTVDSVQSNHITISVAPGVTPVVSIGAVSSFISAGANDTLVANVTSATPTPQYQWYKNDVEIAGATNSYYVVNENTPNNYKYNCTVNSGDACNTTGLSNSFYVTVDNLIVKQISGNGSELNIMPNPNNGSFTMNLQADNDEPATVTITNVLGEKVKELTTTTNTVTAIQLNVAAGVYFLSAGTEHGRYVARVVVN